MNTNDTNKKTLGLITNFLLTFLLIIIAAVERLWFDLGPNVELVTLATLLTGFYLDKKAVIIVPLLILAATDIFIGNTSIMLFTWSAYIVTGLLSLYLKSKTNTSIKRVVLATCGGGISSLWFYLWTNFGVWLLDSWGMYAKTWSGLIRCYVNGLPFLRNQLLGNLIIIPVAFVIIELVISFKLQIKQVTSST